MQAVLSAISTRQRLLSASAKVSPIVLGERCQTLPQVFVAHGVDRAQLVKFPVQHEDFARSHLGKGDAAWVQPSREARARRRSVTNQLFACSAGSIYSLQ